MSDNIKAWAQAACVRAVTPIMCVNKRLDIFKMGGFN